mmetsp:Transcript_18066/g.49889  ORF Transcript_18066/g.49889 Transcript_18066/m.49889 type:complete len:163 (+) Transcript_18066:44-532(+)
MAWLDELRQNAPRYHLNNPDGPDGHIPSAVPGAQYPNQQNMPPPPMHPYQGQPMPPPAYAPPMNPPPANPYAHYEHIPAAVADPNGAFSNVPMAQPVPAYSVPQYSGPTQQYANQYGQQFGYQQNFGPPVQGQTSDQYYQAQAWNNDDGRRRATFPVYCTIC